jgi:acyl-CoA thioesterase-1
LLEGAPTRTLGVALERYAKSYAALLGTIRRISRARLIVCTQYNPFPNSPIAGQGIAALNAVTTRVAGAFHAQIAPVHDWFEGRQPEWIAGYNTGRLEDALRSGFAPVHPNNSGHRAIAHGLLPFVAV